MLKHLANALTLLRLILAPLTAWAVWRAWSPPLAAAQPDQIATSADQAQTWAVTAAALFVLAALTDLFDGMAARAFDGESKFGRILDPIADKALVGLPLAALSVVAWQGAWPLWPAIAAATAVILTRDTLITALRLLASDGEGARVSQLAKWKTALELVVVGAPILLAAVPGALTLLGAYGVQVWTGLLALAAALSAFTALQYLTTPKAPAAS